MARLNPEWINKAKRRAHRQFSIRNVDRRAAPLRRGLDRLFDKVARKVIRRVRREGLLEDALATKVPPRTGAKAAIQKARFTAFDQQDILELNDLLRTFGIRRAKKSGRGVASQFGVDRFVVPPETIDMYMTDRGSKLAQFASSVDDSLVAVLEQTIAEVSIEGGLSPGQITRRLFTRMRDEEGAPLSEGRADRIARTETAAIDNFGIDEGYKAAGITEREWVTIKDGRQRDTHDEIDGQVRAVGVPFDLPDGDQMMFPGDTSLGAKPENTINDRCTTVPVRITS
jgi:hypothetical protein